jgi:hypothetical protein
MGLMCVGLLAFLPIVSPLWTLSVHGPDQFSIAFCHSASVALVAISPIVHIRGNTAA